MLAAQVEKDGGAVEEVVDKLNNAALKLMRARFDLRPHEQVGACRVGRRGGRLRAWAAAWPACAALLRRSQAWLNALSTRGVMTHDPAA